MLVRNKVIYEYFIRRLKALSLYFKKNIELSKKVPNQIKYDFKILILYNQSYS